MYFKKLKLIVPFVLISFTVSTLLSVFILPSPNIKRNEYRVYKDSLGNTFYEELKNHEGKYVLLEQINPKTIDIFLAVEDQNFYTHLGIDGTRIFKALYDNLLKGRITQGASTITQQLAKNNYLDNEQNYIRKLREIFLSFIIENNYTKDDILEAYFNSIYFGHGIYGIENASLFFFGIPSFELNIPQSAMLVGIINAPNLYSPFIDKEKSIDKFHGILNYLYKNKTINSSEYEEYFNYEFNYTFNNNLTLSSSKLFYINGVKKELKKLGLDKENDLIINTYFDPFSNQVIDSIINSIPIKENTNLSVVIMKPFSNKIIALLGGKNYHNSSFNCAIDSSRQIGSTIKPFLYYLGLKSGMTLLTKLNSSPSTFFIQDYGFYEPKNFNSLYAYQDINMLEAIAYSDNIYAVKTGLLVGSKTVKNFFNYFNLEYEETPSSFLGSISLSLLELCDLYNCLASEGKYYSYSFIDSIYKSDGTLLYKNTNSFSNKLSKNETIILNQALTSTTDKNLKGYTNPSMINYKPNATFAIKTGTTYQDNYVIGFNPSYTIGIWLGDMNNNELNEPGVAKRFFQRLANNVCSKSSWYSKNTYMKAKKIDPNTGLDSNDGSLYYFLKKWDI